MKLRVVLVCVFLAATIPAGASQTVAPAEAKRLAVNALKVMNEVEIFAGTPERMTSGDYVRLFDAPLNKVLAEWPAPWFAPENRAIEPYQICSEAALTLQNLGFHRVNKAKNPALHGKEAERARQAYFDDKKPRCEQAVKGAGLTASASKPIK